MDERESLKADAIVREVDERWGASCASCDLDLIGHEIVLSLALGFRDAPRCAPCLARGVGQATPDFLRLGAARIRRLACFRAGWVHSDRRLAAVPIWPEDRVPRELAMLDDDFDAPDDEQDDELELDPAELVVDATYDAHDLSCGDLVLELRKRFQSLAPGEVLCVRATDPAAPRDLPSWCRLTRHVLVGERHPHYWIRRRAD